MINGLAKQIANSSNASVTLYTSHCFQLLFSTVDKGELMRLMQQVFFTGWTTQPRVLKLWRQLYPST